MKYKCVGVCLTVNHLFHNNQTNSDILNSFLPELVHAQPEVKYQQLSGSTHRQQ